ncbi:MAG: O-antigen export system, permease protein [uncultured Acidimicrobiales bacterium]|uniref:Transport permease protein n=1 Tax=uncultured Acidimicrobiales bacterium TaxID=310071 RepID=A0A6J4HV79_9ACTN|nr:MAG: O-antigen export system, permease protein [uncultured Acidimicrobiales bacterium]
MEQGVRPEPAPKPAVVLIRPSGRFRFINIRELWLFRGLLGAMTRRDLTLRYRQTALGLLWVVIQPILAAGIFSVVFGGIGNFSSEGAPYFMFTYAGMLGWNAFSSTLSMITNCLVANTQLVSKIYFPRLLLPLAQLGTKAIDFLIALAVYVVLAQVTGVSLSARILLAPLVLVWILALALGPALITSSLNVSYRDIGYMVPVVLPLFLYLSPVAYSTDDLPERYRDLYGLNPLVGAIDAMRWCLLGRATLSAGEVLYSLGLAAALLVVGSLFFRSRERLFADVI